jgi:hypothetical protein
MQDRRVRDWGELAESDERVRMIFADYFGFYVYGDDFASAPPPPPGFVDNTTDNSLEVYEKGAVAFAHDIPADPNVPRDLWRILRIVVAPRGASGNSSCHHPT